MMHRRTFCLLCSTALAGVLLPLTGRAQVDPALQVQLSLPTELATINDTDTIAELGTAYLDQVGDENNPSRLIAALMVKPGGDAIPANTDRATLQRLMAEKVQSDFKTGETVVVNGWVLSRTEVRQCALFSLTQTGV